MATASVPYSWVANDPIRSSELNSNYSSLVSFLNTSTVHTDASKAFTGVPSGPATDPTTDNQLTRKKYVDDRTKGLLGYHHVLGDSTAAGTTQVDMGVSFAFTVPDISGGGRGIELSLYAYKITSTMGANDIASIYMVKSSNNAAIGVGNFCRDTTVNDRNTAFYIRRTITANDASIFIAGSVLNVKVQGQVFGTGTVQLQGTATYPVEFQARLL